MPQNQDLIATKTVRGEVYIFDRTKHPLKPAKEGECIPDLKLKGHQKEGYAFALLPQVLYCFSL
jgi:histone-binding protein RBBP4